LAWWTFIVWGALNAIYFLPLLLLGKNRRNMEVVAFNKLLPNFNEILKIGTTFMLTVFAWIFFRSENISHAFNYISTIFSKSLFTIPRFGNSNIALPIVILTVVFVMIEWMGREHQFALAKLGLQWKRPFRLIFYYSLIFTIFYFSGKEQQFIYFQF